MKRQAGLLKPKPAQPESAPDSTLVSRAVPIHDALPPPDELLTEDQVIKILKVGRQWLADHRTRVEPIIPHVLLGRTIRYPRAALYEWIARQTETRPTWKRSGSVA